MPCGKCFSESEKSRLGVPDDRKNLFWDSPTLEEQKIFKGIFGVHPRRVPPLPPWTVPQLHPMVTYYLKIDIICV